MNTINDFIQKNLNNRELFKSYYKEDTDLILNSLYTKDFKINNAEEFLNKFRAMFVKRDVLNNFEIVKQRQVKRNLISEPTSGDIFIDDKNNLFRLVSFGDYFQFCYDGSFCMFKNGHASMSGGFTEAFVNGVETYKIHKDNLNKINQKKTRKFWFFKDNSAGANRGLSFNCKVNMYKN